MRQRVPVVVGGPPCHRASRAFEVFDTIPAVPERSLELRPFLKWAGGKRQLLQHFRPYYPQRVGTYFEPFLGSGAVFFDLWNRACLGHARAVLTDQNADLIGCYLRVRDSIDRVVALLRELAGAHADRPHAHYYDVRDGRFNPAREAWQSAGGDAESYSPDLAAMLIYLNRTGYNGLFRQNARGRFNVPVGRYRAPRILNEPLLRQVAAVLSSERVDIRASPFDEAVRHARPGDFVYFDPPYAPVSATAHFRAYTAGGFSQQDQERLQQLTIRLARRGVTVLLSNSTADSVCRLYQADQGVVDAGLRAVRLGARRAINSRADRRGIVDELLVTNYAPH